VTLLAHALAIWALCGATMGIGLAVTSLPNALLVHAVAAPIFAAAVSFVNFDRFGYTTPLVTASCVLGFVVAVDFFVVALAINRSLDMFRSIIGTWLPFALIFGSTLAAGAAVRRSRHGATGDAPQSDAGHAASSS
jgi:hypothetical protein